MPWIPTTPLLAVIVLMFVAALRGLNVRRVAGILVLASFLLSAALACNLFFPLVSDHSGHALVIIAGLLTGLGFFLLVVAFVRLAQPPLPEEPTQRPEEQEAESSANTTGDQDA